MRRMSAIYCAAFLPLIGFACVADAQAITQPEFSYRLFVDSTNLGSVNVAIGFRNMPDTFRVAMAVHPEYDDAYWHNIRDLDAIRVPFAPGSIGWVDTAKSFRAGNGRIARLDSTLWQVVVADGSGLLTYKIDFRPERSPDSRAVWHPFLRADGGLVGGPDFFLYFPDFPDAKSEVEIEIPRSWKIATGLKQSDRIQLVCFVPSEGAADKKRKCSGFSQLGATTAAPLLDSPILLGDLHTWNFSAGNIPHHINYWPLPNATPFDTTAFAKRVAGIAREAFAIFGTAPYTDYNFLFQDGAWGALEHRNSVTIGLPSADLARNVNSYLVEIAHEFFHTWNLVALRPAGWGTLSYKPPIATTGLWWSEGVTMYYAYLLPRRIGFPEQGHTRIEQLEDDLGEYFSNMGNMMVSPERASLLADAGPEERGDFPGDYYLTGRLIGEALELIVSDATHNKHGLDEVMRALYERHPLPDGFAPKDVEYAVSAVCVCDQKRFFDEHVRGSRPLDFNQYLRTIGLQVTLDTVPVADSASNPLPDTRVWVNPSKRDGTMRLMLYNPNSVWAKARLHTGEQLVSFNGIKIDSMPDMRRAVRAIKLNDVVPVDVVRNGVTQRINVTVTGYTKVRAKISDRPDITRGQMAMRDHWLAGRLAEDEFAGREARKVVLQRQLH